MTRRGYLWHNDVWTPPTCHDANNGAPIPEQLLRLVDERAETAGLPREAYIRAVLSKDVRSAPSISEILAPFRDQVAGSGIGDEELDHLFEQARKESYRERSPRQIDERWAPEDPRRIRLYDVSSLARPRIRQTFPVLTNAIVDGFLAALQR